MHGSVGCPSTSRPPLQSVKILVQSCCWYWRSSNLQVWRLSNLDLIPFVEFIFFLLWPRTSCNSIQLTWTWILQLDIYLSGALNYGTQLHHSMTPVLSELPFTTSLSIRPCVIGGRMGDFRCKFAPSGGVRCQANKLCVFVYNPVFV